MAWFRDFLNKLFPIKGKYGGETLIIDIPAELYYKELAVYTASSLIGNAISRSEVKCFINNENVKNVDYFRMNVSPNKNETSSLFWHKVINRVIRRNNALVVELNGCLYCADDFAVEEERPIKGDIYSGVVIGNLSLNKKFNQNNSYLFRLNDENVNALINGMYEDYGKVFSAAGKSFKRHNGQKYKIHIDGLKAGDEDFNKEFEEIVSKQLKNYMENENAIYPEFDGYKLESDNFISSGKSADDFLKLKSDLFSMVASVFHIPESMMKGNITNMKEIVGAFLSFGVDPYADMITEVLNKGAGEQNYLDGNYYLVDTRKINHRDIFDIAPAVANLTSSATMCVDEIRELLGLAPLNEDWSKKHFITKNFEEIQRFLNPVKGGDENGKA